MRKRNIPHLPLSPAQQGLLQHAPNVYLVGLMGSGKSTVGRLLAHALKRDFYDSDEVIIERTGTTISTIFEIEGETGFRDREARVIRELCQKQNIVLGTGGGSVLRESSREVLAATGFVIYLSSTPERLLARTRHDKNRPLLQTADPLATLHKLHEQRHGLYQSVAHVEIKTGAGHVTQVAMGIVQALLQQIAQQQGLTTEQDYDEHS
ncbi:MAG: shikimate kinase [Formosimonas sp.]